VSSRWFLGRAVCDAWTTLDLICCTSSILHLLAISLDRYWAVTQLDYIHHRSTRRILAMIAASWGGSVVISAPPLFIHDPPDSDPAVTGQCIINQNLVYTVFSTVGAFYLPFALMMIVYVKVFRAARDRIRRKLFRSQPRPETTGGLGGVSPDHSRAVTQPLTATFDDVADADQLELNVQTSSPGPESDHRENDVVMLSDRVSLENPDIVHGEEPFEVCQDDENPVHGRGTTSTCQLLSVTGRDWNEVDALTGEFPRRPLCRSESAAVPKHSWTAEDGKTVRVGSVRCVKRPLSLAISCDGSRPPVYAVVANMDQHQHLGNILDASMTSKNNHTAAESNCQCPNGRAVELKIRGTVDSVVVAPACTATSPSGDESAARSRSAANCDHHYYVEDTTSGARRLCLPRKAADRLLTPTSTPIHRSSWVDLTRTLLPSAAALRIQLHGPSVAGRAAGRTARQMVEQRRERKAARTLAVITGTFVLCWLPFFIIAILRPFCGEHCHYPAPLISVIVWLGYVNSLLNPIIYTVFNADFRSAFRKILFGKYRNQRR